jgi:hypothetical protein
MTVAAHVATSLAGGAAIGGLLGLVGGAVSLDARARGAILAVVIVMVVTLELVPGLHLPTVHRQVDEDWLRRYRGWVYGAGYGFQLGLGVVTIVTTSATYAALAASLLSGSVASGAAIGAVFGASRGLVVLTNRSAVDAPRLRAIHRRFQRWDQPVRLLVLSTQAAAVVTLSGFVLGGHA